MDDVGKRLFLPAVRAFDSGSLATARVAIPDAAAALGEPKLMLSNQTTSLLPRIVVADKADGTRVIFFAQNIPDGVNFLQQGKYEVQSTGQSCEEGDCHPFIPEHSPAPLRSENITSYSALKTRRTPDMRSI